MAAQLLIEQGHKVVLHARSEQRGQQALSAVPGAESVVIGDLPALCKPAMWPSRSIALAGLMR
jgi:hypothetical protein